MANQSKQAPATDGKKAAKVPKRALRVLSGTKPTGEHLHLGNYFGALRQFVALQEEHDTALYFIADYHAMTSVKNGAERRRNTLAVALDYLAAGARSRARDFVSAERLAGSVRAGRGCCRRSRRWACSSEHMPTKPRKIAAPISSMASFSYPVLMAADILLFGSHLVPVGKDQKQHIEMARDMAQRFNRAYETEALVLPEPYILEGTATVPGTDGQKMSKSYGNTIPMFGAKGKLKKAVMGIVTDSSPVEEAKDTSQTVFELWSLFANEAEREEMFERAKAGGLGYGDVKKDLLSPFDGLF